MLRDADLEAALLSLPGWTRDGAAITRRFVRRDWRDAIALVNRVADEAERRDHHPDISITGYRTVTFRLTSHDSGGITQRDVNLAKRIDAIAGGTVGEPAVGPEAG